MKRDTPAVLRCYVALLVYSMDTERAVLRLRALRRAEAAREREEVSG